MDAAPTQENKQMDPLEAVLAMARDWTDPVVVRDAPERVGHVIEQLIEHIEALRKWQPIETAPKDTQEFVLIALILDGVIWRVSEARFNGLGWYTKSGEACHWRTHWAPMPVFEE